MTSSSRLRLLSVAGGDPGQRLAHLDLVADGDEEFDHAVDRRGERVLHLHRLDATTTAPGRRRGRRPRRRRRPPSPASGWSSSASPLCSSSGRTRRFPQPRPPRAVRPARANQICPSRRGDEIVGAQPVERRPPAGRRRELRCERAAVHRSRPTAVAACGVPVEMHVVGAVAGVQPDVVGARCPIRQPDGTSHRLPAPVPASCAAIGRPPRRSARRHRRLRGGEVRRPAVEQAGVQPARDDVGIGQQEAQELDVGRHAEHGGVGQRAVERAQRRARSAAWAMTLASIGS